MKEDRKNIILQSLASLLEERNLSKVTTAVLAEKSGITEAALYRHFPSKRSIFSELFGFCDDAIFSKCAEIKKSDLNSEPMLKQGYLLTLHSQTPSLLMMMQPDLHRMIILRLNLQLSI